MILSPTVRLHLQFQHPKDHGHVLFPEFLLFTTLLGPVPLRHLGQGLSGKTTVAQGGCMARDKALGCVSALLFTKAYNTCSSLESTQILHLYQNTNGARSESIDFCAENTQRKHNHSKGCGFSR